MKPPKTVEIGPHTYRVVVDKNAVAHDSVRNGSEVLGYCTTAEQRISIQPDQGPSMLRDTVLHEVLHALFDLTGLAGTHSDDDEERIIRPFATALLDCLRRNPTLVAYLTENT